MNDKYLLSIIIPAYNASRTIERALLSVYKQMTDEVEIVIVENGSSDNTYELLQHLSENRHNVRLLQSAKGVSVARNVGVQSANGEWLTFLDADDYLVEGSISAMLTDIANGLADLYVYGIRTGVQTYDNTLSESKLSPKSEVVRELLENPTKHMQVCASVYRKSLIQEYDIEFDTSLAFAEDSDFTMQYLVPCRQVQLSTRVVIFCPNDEKSTTRTFDGTKYMKYLTSLQQTEQHAVKLGEVAQQAYVVYALMNFNVLMVRDVFTRDNPQSFTHKVQEMKRIADVHFFAEKIRQLRLSQCRRPSLWPFLLMKIKLAWLAGIIYEARARRNAWHERHARKAYRKGDIT